jgi:hypothetical protein
MLISARLAIALAGLGLLLGGCSKLDTEKISAQIQQELLNAKVPVNQLRCPANLTPRTGQTFECVGKLEPEGNFFVAVTQVDDRATIRWEVINSWRLLDLGSLQSDLQTALAAQEAISGPANSLKIDCGQPYRVVSPGDRFECQVIGAGQVRSITVDVRDEGQITWQTPPPALTAQRPSNPPAQAIAPDTSPNPASTDPATANTPADPRPAPAAAPARGPAKDATGWTELAD